MKPVFYSPNVKKQWGMTWILKPGFSRIKDQFIGLFILAVSVVACVPKEEARKITIANPLSEPLKGLVCKINSEAAMQSIASIPEDSLVLMDGDKELPVQFIKENGITKAILVQADFAPDEKKPITVKKGVPAVFKAKTQAELSVKEGGEWVWLTKKNGNQQYEYQGGNWKQVNSLRVDKKHTDHSFDIRYEGPGWESDKVAYRFYLDWRNATDLFGKKVDTLVLQDVGLDGFDSYHELSDWGADILKVGKSLGLGTIAHWADSSANRVARTDSIFSKITYSGILESKITTKYFGWEYKGGRTDLTSELSIRAGSYLTKEHLSTNGPIDNFCTGIIKQDNTNVLTSDNDDGDWGYLATFGVQSLQKDHMGLAVFYCKKDFQQMTEDKLNHVIVLRPDRNELTYYFCGIWEQDASHINNIEKFKAFLEEQRALLNQGIYN